METKIKEIDLPTWFNGEVYTEGSTVTNPYSGESCYLTAKELSMYDFVKGCETVLSNTRGSDNLYKLFYDGLWWFRDNCPTSYMILLD